jgi:hypothetical protein
LHPCILASLNPRILESLLMPTASQLRGLWLLLTVLLIYVLVRVW